MDEVVAKLYNNVGKTFTEENNLLNIAMLEKFRHAKAIMSQLRPAVKILSGDSQGVGSTLAEFVGILQKVEELSGSDDGMPNVIDPTSVLGLMGKYLLIPRSSKIKIKNAKKKGFIPVGIIGGAQYLVKPDSVKAAGALHTLSLTNDLVMSEFSGMFNLINTVSTRAVVRGISVEGKKTISQGIRSYINSNADLFTEDEVTTTLEQLLYPTDTTMSLAEMLEVAKKDSRLKGNKLIQDLETAIEENRPHTISFRNSANDDMVTDSQAIAFLDLLLTKSDTPIGDIGVTPKQLARKLIDYAFLTGGRKSAVDFVRFVPTSYLIDLGFFKTLKEGYAEIKGSEGAQHTNAMVQQILQHNPDLVTKRIRIKQEQSAEENEKGEGVVLNEDSSNGESIIFSPQKGLIEKAGISMGDTGLYMVHSSYDYIAVKPAGNPRRVLKFDHNTGNYVMLDNLGTGTISEYEFGKGTKESVLIENKSSTYFSNETASQENEEEIIPTEAGGGPTISITNQGTIPTESNNEDILTKIKNTFEPPSSDGPKEENPVKPPVEEKPSTTTTQPPKEEVDFDALFKSGSSKEKKEIPTSGEENQSLPSLAAVSKKLEGSNSGFYSPTESEVVQMLEEISESADMTHKYLAREILNSGVLGKKQFKLIFKSGNTLESNFNKQGQKVTINIDNNTSNWDFEQTVLHEIGHALTAFEIARFKDNPNSVSPKMKASLEKLDTLRKLFLKKLENKSRQEIENYLAFTKDSESKIQNKIRELHAAGDVAAIQKILMAGYGASNLDEFVTMVMSNGAFRDMLDNTIDFNLTDGSVDKSLLVQIMSVLKDMFRQIFGLEKRKISEYALDQAMFVAKNQYTGTDTGYTDDSETVVLRNGKQYTYNGSSVIDSASNVVTDKKILNQVERKLALSRNNSTKVSEGGKEYYVYEGFDKIEVARINKNGTVTKLKPAEADKIIPKAFVGSDGIITGGKSVPIPTTKIISGAQTGVDQLGLEVGKELGMETGGTATPGFVTEKGKDVSLKEKYGVEEITADLQKGQKGREFYLPRTEENAKNSDGTVYFATDADSAGRVATERYAKKHNKPFILNPTAEQLRKFLADNNIKTLNVAGNRGSKLNPNQKGNIKNILLTALAKQPSSEVVKAPLEGVSNADIAEMSNEEYKELVETGYTQWLDENGELAEANYERPIQQTVRKTYKGKVTSLQPNQVFVFGSNEGGSKGQKPTHGAGGARIARDKFGAIQGQSKGIQGQSYAIVTKKFYDVVRSSTAEEIKLEVEGLYEYARQNPDKEFLVSDYSGKNLNGYTEQEMAQIFNEAGTAPANIVHNENFQKVIDTTQPDSGTKPAPLQQRKVEVTRSDIPSNLLGEQREAAQLIMDFLDDPSGPQEFSLVGKAGTGKTTTISSIIKAYQKKVRGKIVIGALSHKATQVIEGSIKEFYESSNEALNNKKIEFSTVASMMGLKLDEETNEFEEDGYTPNKLGSAGLVIIDESSMINEEALEKLKSRLPNSSKIIFLGDSGQLSPIRKSKAYRQGKYKVDKSAISPIFTSSEFGDTNSFKLLTRRRQGEDSKILPFADFFWDEAHKSSEASNYPAGKDQRVNSEELKFVKTEQDALVESYPIFEKAVKDKNPNLIKVIAYRNATVKRVNNDIRNAVLNFPTDGIVEGEIMVANGSFIVESEHGSRGGRVSNPINPELTIEITNSTQIIVGKVSEKQTYEVDGKAFGYYMVEIQQGQNLQSVPVLDPGSAEKWAAYKKSLWNAAFTAKRNKTSNAKQLMAKAAGSTYRTFAPFDYGYAITSHKSQGSGYDNVIVHEADIYSVAPTSNAQKHRSMYTAITRARKNAIIIDRGDVKVSTPSTTTSSGDQGYDLFGNRLGLLPLQGTVDEFLRELDPAERRFFNQLSKEGKLKTICKLG